jgi:hypothetical protein
MLYLLYVANWRYQVSVNSRRTAGAEAQGSDTPPSLDGPDEVQRSKRVTAAAGLLSAVLLLIAAAATQGHGKVMK